VVPLIISITTIPFIVLNLGVEKFGFLSLYLVLIGYFGLLDFGLGKATTRFMRISNNNKIFQNQYFWTSYLFSLFIGILFSAIAFYFYYNYSIFDFLNIELSLRVKFQETFKYFLLCVPIFMTGNVLIGALESRDSFKLLNIIHVIIEAAIRIFPVIVIFKSNDVTYIIFGILLIKSISVFIYLFFCFKKMPELFMPFKFNVNIFNDLFSYGKWLLLSNIIGPLMIYMDRFVIGALLSVKQLTFYTIPFDFIKKIQAIPLSVGRAIFPTLSEDKCSRNYIVYKASTIALYVMMIPISIFIYVFSKDILSLWLGISFAVKSYLLLKIISIGVFLNAVSKPAFTYLQASGRTDITAKAHLFELPFYIVSLYIFINSFGLVGVPVAWVVRVLIDRIILLIFTENNYWEKYFKLKQFIFEILIFLSIISSSVLPLGKIYCGRLLFLIIWLIVLYAILFSYLLNIDEKRRIYNYFKINGGPN